jgi:gentisate 1,2-dioxygenase
MATQTIERSAGLEAWMAELRAAGLDAPWTRPGPLIPSKATQVQTRHWRWAEIEPLVRRGPEFMKPGRGAERRVIRLDNPGVPERTSTHTISTAVQYLLPGEVAPAHRHSPSAVRFMLEGQGAYTTVEGAKCAMKPGDLVITPTMTWHDHGNEGAEPVIWMDGLDSPVVRYLEILAYEAHTAERQQVGAASTRTIHYHWDASVAELERRAAGPGDPFDDVLMEYLDPETRTSVTPVLGAYLQLLRPGVRTRAHRETSSAVYRVVRGSGFTVVDGVRYDWVQGDFLAIAPRALHAHGNEGREPALLFSFQDVPLLRALGLHRVEA